MMRPPAINLARRPFRNNTVYWAVFGSCLVLLLAASIYSIYDFMTRGTDLARLEAEYDERSRDYMDLHNEVESMKRALTQVNLSALDTRSAFANELIVKRLFSWSLLFDRIEDLIPPDVKIRSIRPSISTQTIEVQIDGLAKVADDLYAFEANLDGSDWFAGVYPLSESTRETRNEINFDLVMQYVPNPPAVVTTASVETTVEEAAPQGADDADEPEEEIAQADEAGEAPPPAVATVTTAPSAGPAAAAPGGTTAPSIPAPVATGPAPSPPPIDPNLGAMPSWMKDAAAQQARPTGGKPPFRMNNREFYEAFGQERFMTLRGEWKPGVPSGPNGALTNAEFIEKIGVDAFLKERGDLDRAAQDTGGPPLPGAVPPGGGGR